MIVTHLNSGRKVNFTIDEDVLSIGNLSINLQERQRDVQHVIDISLDGAYATLQEGVGAWYVATIIIPPKEYQLVEDGDSEMNMVSMPLDLSKVEIRLWSLPEGVDL
ncbi:hypothetical protein B1690_05975 [Geobacillus sp. 46C-IIa]|uniref:hypothetical protein n=1 Tax=Geobacillus sp. 46C-IIa TaxID=1963025 RepID=UPI0009C0FF78|nr:hypothetical protein [Geobacillus sp. 46C-IIa]OQP06857.1 hypothetical protein B1690_05975 [Geobacillus sp. 46C-IIa]QNU27425.1 AAA family ATPase [Geobacillus sp. 46C-IIa]